METATIEQPQKIRVIFKISKILRPENNPDFSNEI